MKPDLAHGLIPLDFPADALALGAQGFAVRALGALGPRARAALPALEAIAAEKLVDIRGTFQGEPQRNAVIREARKAVQAIR